MFNNGLFLIATATRMHQEMTNQAYLVPPLSHSLGKNLNHRPPQQDVVCGAYFCAEGSRKAGGSQTVFPILPMALVVCSAVCTLPDKMKNNALSQSYLFTST